MRRFAGPRREWFPRSIGGHYKSFSKEEIDAFLEQVGDSVSEIRGDGIEGKDYCCFGACTSGGASPLVPTQTVLLRHLILAIIEEKIKLMNTQYI